MRNNFLLQKIVLMMDLVKMNPQMAVDTLMLYEGSFPSESRINFNLLETNGSLHNR